MIAYLENAFRIALPFVAISLAGGLLIGGYDRLAARFGWDE